MALRFAAIALFRHTMSVAFMIRTFSAAALLPMPRCRRACRHYAASQAMLMLIARHAVILPPMFSLPMRRHTPDDVLFSSLRRRCYFRYAISLPPMLFA